MITQALKNYVKKRNNEYSKFAKSKNENLKNFIRLITRPTEISHLNYLKGQNKNISLTFSMKALKILRALDLTSLNKNQEKYMNEPSTFINFFTSTSETV